MVLSCGEHPRVSHSAEQLSTRTLTDLIPPAQGSDTQQGSCADVTLSLAEMPDPEQAAGQALWEGTDCFPLGFCHLWADTQMLMLSTGSVMLGSREK